MVAQMITIGIASWNNLDKLKMTIESIGLFTKSDFKCIIYDNCSEEPVREYLKQLHASDNRFVPIFGDTNIGYVGAVNYLLENSDTEYIAYVDNDCQIKTDGWDLKFIETLDKHPEVAMIFGQGPGAGVAYKIPREDWTEVLWGVGCFWMLRKSAQKTVGLFDTNLGHQEEVDYQTRIRLAGLKIAFHPDVKVHHYATATRNPEAEKRINDGIINWMNKWVKYFCGEHMDYFSPNVIRFAEWPVNAVYLEEWYKTFIPDVNDDPETVTMEGREYHLIKVPRTGGGAQGSLYVGRII